MTGREISRLLSRYRLPFSSEKELQNSIEGILSSHHVAYEREWRLNSHNRPDFYLPEPKIAIEIKIKGSRAAVADQLERYAGFYEVAEIVLISTRMQHCAVPDEINGKPVHRVHLWNL